MINLYALPLSPFAAKIHFFLEETGIPYKYNVINHMDDAGRRTLDAINPLSKVPAIEVNGFHLGESNTILRYLADRYSKNTFYPLNLEERAKVDMLVEFATAHVDRWLSILSYGLHWSQKLGMKANAAMVEEAQSMAPQMLERLERVVSGNTYLAGPEMTLADCNLLPFLAQWKFAQINLAAYPTLDRWLSRMTERPAWSKAEKMIDEWAQQLQKRRAT